MNSVKRYKQIVIELLLSHKELNIAEVNNFERVKSLFLDMVKYPSIVSMIKEKKWDELKMADIEANGSKEYVDIVKFTDQNNRPYATTLYDSDVLWQELKLMDIFPLA